MSLDWDSSPLSLNDAVKSNRFPVVAKVHDACEIAGGKSLKKGELLTIHGKRTVVKFHGFDNNGCEIFIPANSGLKARLRVPADSSVFDTVKDICVETPAPKFVEVTQDREYGGQQNSLKTGDRLKVLLVERNGDGPTHMHFRNQNGKHVRLSADFQGPFKPCSEDNQIHSLLDLAKQPLPFTIEVLPESSSGSRLAGIVQIIDILTEDIALASVRHKKIYAVVLPIQLGLSVVLPQDKSNSIYEELAETQSSSIDVDLIQGYVDNHCSSARTSTCYTPYDGISHTSRSKKEKRPSNLKSASLGSRQAIKAAGKLLKAKKKNASSDNNEEKEEKTREEKTKVFKSKSLRKFKDKMRRKSETNDTCITDGPAPTAADSEDRCSVTSSPSPQEGRKITSIDESEDELKRKVSRDDSDTDDYEDPLPVSPNGSKSKTNTLIGRMWKKMKAQKTKSGEETKNGNGTQPSQIITGDLYTSLDQDDDEGLYEEIEVQMAYESLDFVQEARRTMGLPAVPMCSGGENSGDSGFLDLPRPGGPRARQSNSPLPPLPPNHPLDKKSLSYSAEDLYEESVDLAVAQQVEQADWQSFYETVKKSEMEIASWSSEELAACLKKLQLALYVIKFNDSQIDGGLLIDLDEAVFKDFGMSSFQARKLRKFVFGWRPDEMKKGAPGKASTANDDDPTTWTGVEVGKRLLSIGMDDVAKFCKSNQVNGDLLKDIVVDDEIMNAIISGADKRLKLIKLRNYVIDAWRPRLKSDASVLKKIQTQEIDIGEKKSTPPQKRSGNNYVAPVVASNRMASNPSSSGSRIASIKQQLMSKTA